MFKGSKNLKVLAYEPYIPKNSGSWWWKSYERVAHLKKWDRVGTLRNEVSFVIVVFSRSMRNGHRKWLAPAHDLPVYCFEIRKRWPILKVWQTRRTNNLINFRLRFPLYFGMFGHQIEKGCCDGYGLLYSSWGLYPLWVARFAYTTREDWICTVSVAPRGRTN